MYLAHYHLLRRQQIRRRLAPTAHSDSQHGAGLLRFARDASRKYTAPASIRRVETTVLHTETTCYNTPWQGENNVLLCGSVDPSGTRSVALLYCKDLCTMAHTRDKRSPVHPEV